MVAAIVVCDWSGGRLDSVSWIAPESHRRADDLLATAAAGGRSSNHIFCDLLLSRECRCIFKPGLAIDCRTSYPGLYPRIPSVDACDLDERSSPNHSRGAREYVAHGSAGCAPVAGCDLPAIWIVASPQALGRP